MELFYSEAAATIFNGNALDVLKGLSDESVQMCMTSPPYWGLRNYAGGSDIVWGGDESCQHEWGDSDVIKKGHPGNRSTLVGTQTAQLSKDANDQGSFCIKCGAWKGQLGLEPLPDLYVDHLMMIFHEVKRVLKKTGSFYLNMGDTYTSGNGSCFNPGGGSQSWQPRNDKKVNYPTGRDVPNRMYQGIPPGCMTMIPERVMFAMVDDGWILRNKLIWRKPNSMPGSQKSRMTATWEYVYFFTKSYTTCLWRNRETGEWRDTAPNKEEKYPQGGMYRNPDTGEVSWEKRDGWVKMMPVWAGFDYYFELDNIRIPHKTQSKGKFDDLSGHGPQPQSFNLRVRDVKRGKKGSTALVGELRASEEEIENYDYPEKHHGSSMTNEESLHRDRQKHQEADLGPQSPARKHHSGYYGEDGKPLVDFAKGKNPGDTWEDTLWEITTKPSSISVCPKCDTVFRRYVKTCPKCGEKGMTGHFAPYPESLCINPILASTRIGDVVLDPFCGSGTTGVAAKRLGRKAILIDVVRAYVVMARYNLKKVEYQPELVTLQ